MDPFGFLGFSPPKSQNLESPLDGVIHSPAAGCSEESQCKGTLVSVADGKRPLWRCLQTERGFIHYNVTPSPVMFDAQSGCSSSPFTPYGSSAIPRFDNRHESPFILYVWERQEERLQMLRQSTKWRTLTNTNNLHIRAFNPYLTNQINP